MHKAQGWAFKRVIIPVVSSKLLGPTMHSVITRDIETVVLVGDPGYINESISMQPTSLTRSQALVLHLQRT
ncbi:hypothetical protein QA648_34110 (plasmid) [Rhizobium sp. CB3171]|uniref:hypothetical protein n=1 Tax=Rhizobium sp. CB3171 TaxID=3039157 RepID=UPI0024B166B8|nr:hypothetical protein [Rhizobium sp. CB3171]WFU06816.1 hypothetical protein QA648_34110 [Rhizobium sp. CB3171]